MDLRQRAGELQRLRLEPFLLLVGRRKGKYAPLEIDQLIAVAAQTPVAHAEVLIRPAPAHDLRKRIAQVLACIGRLRAVGREIAVELDDIGEGYLVFVLDGHSK